MRDDATDRRPAARGLGAWLAMLAVLAHVLLPGTMPTGGDGAVICTPNGVQRIDPGGAPQDGEPSTVQHCMLCRLAAAPAVLTPPARLPAPPRTYFTMPAPRVAGFAAVARIASPLQPRAPPAFS
ncbi:MAG: DUF2946 family protein [Rhodospirillales bacterium]